jgi:hypothetical protein
MHVEPSELRDLFVITVPDDGCNYAQRAASMSKYWRTAYEPRPLIIRHAMHMLELIAEVGMMEAIEVVERRVRSVVSGKRLTAVELDITLWYSRAHGGSDTAILDAACVMADINARILMMRIMRAESAMLYHIQFVIDNSMDEDHYYSIQDAAFARGRRR